MPYNYQDLASTTLPPEIEMPPGLREDANYVFSVTYTDPDAMALKEFAEAAATAIERDGKDLGTYPPPQGHIALREFISSELSAKRGSEISPENIFLTSGAGGACQVFVDSFINPGDVVMMDEFCYHGSLNMFLKKGARPCHVAMDQDGIIPEKLEAAIKENIQNGHRPKLIYTISVYHNPTGATISLERRKKIVEISNKYEIPIVENESYADFHIDGPELPPAMIGLDSEGGVMHISAFTKLMGCGLRLGFGAFPESARESLAKVGFGLAPSHLTSMAVHEYLKDNKSAYVAGVAASLGRKRDAMLRSLGEYFPPTCTWTEPQGGMMIWMKLPEGTNTWDILEKSVEKGVKYNPGPIFRADRSGGNHLRLTFSHHTPEEIEEGIAVLAGVFEGEGVI
ncbi:MAG: PLP-dependent aminotransferase family protein [SAR202 cluster bacterium]|jgi:2-aminoadipate transaminase|nr:MAG: PLP-dependent aminotransferase family protein [SAR202 cluster bacterium]KAA1303057.1 MAG: PLP-dependent aminotransferase family protein [SAR202 cluster bacterium]MEC7733595.1 PLP-dependent aminotransferase family protein [Chloroflexota bacterium]MEC8986935.1 PLP-dependent aminotransferase family protein [Chloroflexota bacterium]MED5410135.1 PLP-dependent aminotransferase family protein [Chloroflexota bacterium]|tara:strand:+ start:3413 stop:4606 length:1194 start_codon:yes stop_codon:yes gene_type:complete